MVKDLHFYDNGIFLVDKTYFTFQNYNNVQNPRAMKLLLKHGNVKSKRNIDNNLE